MSNNWKPIYLSSRVFGHLSQGLYRTPAGAVKELISNSFDADAKLVRIHTGFPRFETFSCEDDGTGLSETEFVRLMNRGIGSSEKRTSGIYTKELHRPYIGRLGLGILSLAQICTQFDIVSHHKATKTAFRATIRFPAYTRQAMDKITRSVSAVPEIIEGGTYQIEAGKYDAEKRGLRVFTKYLREPFRKRMRESLARYGNKIEFRNAGPYRLFGDLLDVLYATSDKVKSLNLLSEYDQLLFGLALAAPLPYAEPRNIAAQARLLQARQARLKEFNFRVEVDNLRLSNPVCLPSDRDEHTAKQCTLGSAKRETFELRDGPTREVCEVTRRTVEVKGSDEQFNDYEFSYKSEVAGNPLRFSGYLFQQTGRLYPRDIQGVLIRLSNVAIGKYDNSMLTYPYAEGPRYSMVSSEIFVESGFEDALNIDRDSFNELHSHYIRVQSYVHSLLHDLIFPETWSGEKKRNKLIRDRRGAKRELSFAKSYLETTGDTLRSIQRVKKRGEGKRVVKDTQSPVEFHSGRGAIQVNWAHPLLQVLSRRRKYAAIVEKVVIAFERSLAEGNVERRRQVFYKLLGDIFANF